MLTSFQAYTRAHKQALQLSFNQLCQVPFASFILVAVIGIALSLPMGLWLISINGKAVIKRWHVSPQISVFLENMPEKDSKALLDNLRKMPQIAFANYISPSQGLQQLEEQTGMDDVSRLLEQNPLPAVIELHPMDVSKIKIDSLVAEVKKLKGIEQVKIDLQWLMRLESILNLAERALTALMVVLCCAVLLVIGNSIRLAIFNRKKEVMVLKLIGATNGYIRRPFLYFGFIHGLLGAGLAWFVVSLFIGWLQSAALKIADLYYIHFELLDLSFINGLLLLGLGSFLGLLGSYISVWRQIRTYDLSASF